MNLSRHSDLHKAIDYKTPIAVIGCGGIGSWTVMNLAKVGFTNITVFDDDTVDDVNIPSQCFSPNQIGKTKAQALKDVIALMTGTDIEFKEKKFDEGSFEIIIAAVDSMAARKGIAEKLKAFDCNADVVFDARMAIECGVLRSYNREGADKYIESLSTDDEALQEACSNKAIAYTTCLIGSLITKYVCSHLMGENMTGFDFSLEIGESTRPDFVFHKKNVSPRVETSRLRGASHEAIIIDEPIVRTEENQAPSSDMEGW